MHEETAKQKAAAKVIAAAIDHTLGRIAEKYGLTDDAICAAAFTALVQRLGRTMPEEMISQWLAEAAKDLGDLLAAPNATPGRSLQ
jgi:hypothetical protein